MLAQREIPKPAHVFWLIQAQDFAASKLQAEWFDILMPVAQMNMRLKRLLKNRPTPQVSPEAQEPFRSHHTANQSFCSYSHPRGNAMGLSTESQGKRPSQERVNQLRYSPMISPILMVPRNLLWNG